MGEGAHASPSTTRAACRRKSEDFAPGDRPPPSSWRHLVAGIALQRHRRPGPARRERPRSACSRHAADRRSISPHRGVKPGHPPHRGVKPGHLTLSKVSSVIPAKKPVAGRCGTDFSHSSNLECRLGHESRPFHRPDKTLVRFSSVSVGRVGFLRGDQVSGFDPVIVSLWAEKKEADKTENRIAATRPGLMVSSLPEVCHRQ